LTFAFHRFGLIALGTVWLDYARHSSAVSSSASRARCALPLLIELQRPEIRRLIAGRKEKRTKQKRKRKKNDEGKGGCGFKCLTSGALLFRRAMVWRTQFL